MRARTAARIVRIDQKRFTFLVHEHPTFALQVMRVMARWMDHGGSWRALTGRIGEYAWMGVYGSTRRVAMIPNHGQLSGYASLSSF